LEASVNAKKKLALPVIAHTAQKYKTTARLFYGDYYRLLFRRKPQERRYICASMFLFVNSERVSVPETDYLSFSRCGEGSTAGGVKSMSISFYFQEKDLCKSYVIYPGPSDSYKKSCQKILQKAHNPIFYKNSIVFWTFPSSLTAASSPSSSFWTTINKM